VSGERLPAARREGDAGRRRVRHGPEETALKLMSKAPFVAAWISAARLRHSTVSMPIIILPPGARRLIRLISLEGSKRLKRRSRRSISPKTAWAACRAYVRSRPAMKISKTVAMASWAKRWIAGPGLFSMPAFYQ
jgi:hypothetical protein